MSSDKFIGVYPRILFGQKGIVLTYCSVKNLYRISFVPLFGLKRIPNDFLQPTSSAEDMREKQKSPRVYISIPNIQNNTRKSITYITPY